MAERTASAQQGSHKPRPSTMFDFAHQRSISRAQIYHLHQLDFVPKAHNMIFLGPPGTGKHTYPSPSGGRVTPQFPRDRRRRPTQPATDLPHPNTLRIKMVISSVPRAIDNVPTPDPERSAASHQPGGTTSTQPQKTPQPPPPRPGSTHPEPIASQNRTRSSRRAVDA